MDKDRQLLLRSIRNSLFILADMKDGHSRNVQMKGMLEMIRVSMEGHLPGCDNFGCQDSCPVSRGDQTFRELIRGKQPEPAKVEEVFEGQDVSPEDRLESAREQLRQVVLVCDTLRESCADDLRAGSWSVAAHNDYRLDGMPHTFWLLTHPDGRWIKGEGRTDGEALNHIRAELK